VAVVVQPAAGDILEIPDVLVVTRDTPVVAAEKLLAAHDGALDVPALTRALEAAKR